jgi:hypothetical protein
VFLTAPFTTCCTRPVDFSSTSISFGPRNAIVVGVSRPLTAVRTASFGSTIVGPSDSAAADVDRPSATIRQREARANAP